MTTITERMTADHRRCDQMFAKAESSVAETKWSEGSEQFSEFQAGITHHFSMEEGVLFPAFEQYTGMTTGPTQVMRMEHQQMRQLLSEMAYAVEQQDKAGYLGLSETLMMLMQQHNMKEEQMLYRMADQAIGGEVEQILGQMDAV